MVPTARTAPLGWKPADLPASWSTRRWRRTTEGVEMTSVTTRGVSVLNEQPPRWSCSTGADGCWCPTGEPVCPESRWQIAPWKDGHRDPTARLCDPNNKKTDPHILSAAFYQQHEKHHFFTCTMGVILSGKPALMMAFLVVPTKSSPGFPSARARTGPKDSPTWTRTTRGHC